MPDDDLLARLESLRGTRRYVSIARDPALGRAPLGCVVEEVGESLALVQEIRDFHRRAFVVLRIADIVAVVDDDVERLFGQMIAAEGVLAELVEAPRLDLDHWFGCLRDLKRRYEALTLECEGAEPPAFYLGRLTAVTREAASMRYISVEGVLEREAVEIPLEDLTLACFDDRYSTFFGRHASEGDRH